MQIKIISSFKDGLPQECAACIELKKLVRACLDELGLRELPVEECASEEEYKSLGVIATPVLIINGKVKLAGRVAPKEMLKQFLSFELKSER